MGYTTDFIGHIDIEPALNEAEIAYLTAFSKSRRWDRPGGPYDVPGNPRADEDDDAADSHRANVPPAGQPGLWCDWVPCWDGCCLSYNGVEKFYGSTQWLLYLIDHFLKPGAAAQGDPRFAEFGFDHLLEGIVVEANRVREQVLRAADRRYLDYPPLPYEQAIDAALSPRARRRRERAGVVMPFTRPDDGVVGA